MVSIDEYWEGERCDGQHRRALGWEDVTERWDGQHRRALGRG